MGSLISSDKDGNDKDNSQALASYYFFTRSQKFFKL